VSQIIDLMDELKAAEGMTSDYQLSKETGIAQSRISDYRKGRLTPDEYACTRLALALGREPIEVIAMVQAEQAKTEEKREFWRNFLTRAACIAGLAVPLSFGLPCENARADLPAQTNNTRHKHTLYAPWVRWLRALKNAIRRHKPTPKIGACA